MSISNKTSISSKFQEVKDGITNRVLTAKQAAEKAREMGKYKPELLPKMFIKHNGVTYKNPERFPAEGFPHIMYRHSIVMRLIESKSSKKDDKKKDDEIQVIYFIAEEHDALLNNPNKNFFKGYTKKGDRWVPVNMKQDEAVSNAQHIITSDVAIDMDNLDEETEGHLENVIQIQSIAR